MYVCVCVHVFVYAHSQEAKKKREEEDSIVSGFNQMLEECETLTHRSTWDEISILLQSDPRCVQCFMYMYMYMYMYLYIYIYIYVCVCVCVPMAVGCDYVYMWTPDTRRYAGGTRGRIFSTSSTERCWIRKDLRDGQCTECLYVLCLNCMYMCVCACVRMRVCKCTLCCGMFCSL